MSAVLLAGLTPSTMNFSGIGKGAVPELSRAEMAGYLRGLSIPATNYALAKYCCDNDAFKLLQFHCAIVATKYASEKGWKANKGKPCIISLGVLACIESVNPHMCFLHNSLDMVGDKVCTCDKHRKSIKHVDRARYVDVCIRQWQMVWRDRYEYLFNYCQSLESELLQILRNNK